MVGQWSSGLRTYSCALRSGVAGVARCALRLYVHSRVAWQSVVLVLTDCRLIVVTRQPDCLAYDQPPQRSQGGYNGIEWLIGWLVHWSLLVAKEQPNAAAEVGSVAKGK